MAETSQIMVAGSEISARAVVAEISSNAAERVNSSNPTVGKLCLSATQVDLERRKCMHTAILPYCHTHNTMNQEPPVVPGLLPMPPLADGSVPLREPERAANLVRFQSELEVCLGKIPTRIC